MANRVQAGSGAKDPKHKGPKRHAPKGPSNTQTQGNANLGNSGGRSGLPLRRGRIPAMAQALVDAQIRAGVDDARKERRVIRRESDTARRKAKTDHRRALGDLNYIFGETGDYMGAMGQQIDSNFTDATARAQASQAALVQQLQQNSQGVAGAVGGELSQFGIGQMDMSGFQHDALMSQNLASQTGANQIANLNAQQQGAAAISSLLQGMNAGSKASQYGIQQNVLNDQLSDVYQNKRDGYNQVREAISDLRGKRGDLTLQMLQQLAGSQWAKYLAPRGGGRRGQSNGSGGSFSAPSGGGSSSGGGNKKPPKGNNGGNADLQSLLMGALNSNKR